MQQTFEQIFLTIWIKALKHVSLNFRILRKVSNDAESHKWGSYQTDILRGTDNLKNQVLLSSSVDLTASPPWYKILFACIYCVCYACVCVFKSVSMCESHPSYQTSPLVALHILFTKAGSCHEPSTSKFSQYSQPVCLFLPSSPGLPIACHRVRHVHVS